MKNQIPSDLEVRHHLFTRLNHIVGMAQVLNFSELDGDQQQCVETIIHAGLELRQQLDEHLLLREGRNSVQSR